MRKPREKPVIRTFLIDETGGDRIMMKQYEKRTTLYIILKAEGGRKREIGKITKSTKTLKIIRRHSEHYFKAISGYGFNEYVLRTGKSFDKIWLKDEYSEWKIPVSYILKKGQYLDEEGNVVKKDINYMWFQKQGFELQVFMPLYDIEQFKVLKKENRRF